MLEKSSILPLQHETLGKHAPSIAKERKSACFRVITRSKKHSDEAHRGSPTSKTHAKTTWKLKVSRGKKFFSKIFKTFTFEDWLVKMAQW